MKKNEKITKILTRGVVTTHVGEKVSDVRKLFAKNGFHHVPVVSGKKLVGLLSSTDILGISVEGLGSDDRSMDAYLDHQFSIEGLMQTDLQTLPLESTIADAADALSDGRFHAIPIIDADGSLLGLVTSTDLIRFLRDLF
ncbi:MAG: CBS domain-containing protein [Deltaproteobacteria bacterium]|jgi:CBS domain-containing protein|nr:CBS domain-containing protein [Deltaproteobacteria bacterium]